jgi:NodT family efflux transporter outer membrane factor (OMF) lipoprotein
MGSLGGAYCGVRSGDADYAGSSDKKRQVAVCLGARGAEASAQTLHVSRSLAMRCRIRSRFAAWAVAAAIALVMTGCTHWRDYIHNGFKVGPNYCPPSAPVASHWIDEADVRMRTDDEGLNCWWSVFHDPVLDALIHDASQQNLSLRQAGLRVLQARYQLAITTGELFPQQQDIAGSFTHAQRAVGDNTNFGLFSSTRVFDQWNLGFNLAWELDFWGRFRRAVAASEAQLDASVADYDDVLVTLLGDIATNYVQMRVYERQIELATTNVKLQQESLDAAQSKLEAGLTADLDTDQARSNLWQTKAQIPLLQINQRQAVNRLCVLLGTPPMSLAPRLGTGPIPTAPTDVAVGIPAQLLARRPDVRRAEREAAAQAEQIGIAEAELYPAIAIGGSLGYQASQFSNLFSSNALNGSVGPSFQWNVLNYGRLANNVWLQDAAFRERVAAYQQTVLLAAEEVEDGLITFLRSQQRVEALDQSVTSARAAADTVFLQYQYGSVDFNRVALIQQDLVVREDLLAQAQGQIAIGLIQVYRALGGGWQVLAPPAATLEVAEPIAAPTPDELIPVPQPLPAEGT